MDNEVPKGSIPFTKEDTGVGRWRTPKGSLVDYDSGWSTAERYDWKPKGWTLEAYLKVDSFYRGRSAAGIRLVNVDTGAEYIMRIKLLMEMMQKASIRQGNVAGVWGFRKQGANWSIAYEGPLKNDR